VIAPNKQAELTNNKATLVELLNKLSDKEKHILYNRFGIGNKKIKTLEEIGNKFGVTRERIRQIEMIALRKLRKLVTAKYRINDGSKQPEIVWNF
jgi:RNA polymerase primary sigma factor